MSHSEIIGSFVRTGPFPLEANYIFKSEQDLKEFYSDEINATTMHKGLLRVVEVDDTGKQSLWWVVEKGEELEFEKLLDLESFEKLSELEELLQKEIEDRKTAEDAIWGDEDHTLVDQDLNSLLDLAKAVKELREKADDLKDELKATVGTEEDNIIEYLQTLPYTSLTEIANALKELTDGGFVKNLQGGESKCVKVNVVNEVDKTTVYARVKLSTEAENDIQCKDNGLYCNIDSEYSDGILTIRVNGNVRQQHNLGLSFIGIHDAKYESDTESIYIEFKLQSGETKVLRIPVNGLIAEWEVDNTHPTKVVELIKERVEAGGADKLSADVRISEKKNNILEKDNNTLYVKGTADNIVFEGDYSVKKKIEDLEENKLNKSDIPTLDEFASKEWVEEQGYLTEHQSLEGYVKYTPYQNRKTIQLDNYDSVSGIMTDGKGVNLAMVSKWDIADFGSTQLPINLNGSKDRPTYNDTKEIALLSDIPSLDSIEEELDKKVEKVELNKVNELTYQILVDGSIVGTIEIPENPEIPEDQHITDVKLEGNTLKFITTSGISIKDIDLSEIVTAETQRAQTEEQRLSEEISRVESECDQQIQDLQKAIDSKVTLSGTIGSNIKPVYLNDGEITEIGYTIETSVPTNAIFTDTTYTISEGDANGQIKITPSTGEPYNITIKGLGSAAFTNSDDYAKSSDLDAYQLKGDYATKDDLNNYQPKGEYALASELNNYQPKGNYADASDLSAYLPLTGGTVTGPILLSGNNHLKFGDKYNEAYIHYDNSSAITISGTGSAVSDINLITSEGRTKIQIHDTTGITLTAPDGIQINPTNSSAFPIGTSSKVMCPNLNVEMLGGSTKEEVINAAVNKILEDPRIQKLFKLADLTTINGSEVDLNGTLTATNFFKS